MFNNRYELIMYAYGADITLVVASSDETIAEDSTPSVGLGDKSFHLVWYFMNTDFWKMKFS